MFRGSYGTGFRVPTFNQIFNGDDDIAQSGQHPGRSDLVPDGQHHRSAARLRCRSPPNR